MSEQSGWRREEKELEEAAGSISFLRKEINKETQIDASVQNGIRERIEELKLGAGVLARRLENQKHKNAELELIIRSMQNKMEEQRYQVATSKDGSGFESVATLETRFKKLEYDLTHLSSKANRLGENVQTKRSKVNQNRTERVIDSGIFRNIEKELILSELRFKKMLIEKINYQKEYERLIHSYEQMKSKAASYYEQKKQGKSKVGKSSSINSHSDQELSKQAFQLKFVQVNVRDKERKRTAFDNRTGETFIDVEIGAERECKVIEVQKMMSHLGLESCEDLLFYFDKIDSENDRLFNEINILVDQCGEIQKYIDSTFQQKLKKRMKFYSHKEEPSQNMLNRLKAKQFKLKVGLVQNQIQDEMNQLNRFLCQKEFKMFEESMQVQPIEEKDITSANFQQIFAVLQILQQHIHKYLRENVIVSEQQKGITSRAASQQKLLDMLSNVQQQQCMRVMKKEQFERDYGVLIKGTTTTTKKKIKVLPTLSNRRSSSNMTSKR